VRAIPRALLLAFALLLVAAPAAMAGPGITFYPKAGPVLSLSGAQLSGSADLPARTITLPDDSATPGKKITVRGLSIAALVARSGQPAQRVQVVNSHGGSFVVTQAQFGSAMLADDGATTRYIRTSGGIVTDYTEDSSVPLEVSVDDAGDLAITAKARPKRVKVGEPVTFEANVRFGVPGVQYSYEWDFGEGPVAGKSVNYTPRIAGTLFAQVAVRNPDPGCTLRCDGSEQVTVAVGEAPKQPDAATAGGANGTPGGAGSSGASGGGGTGSGAGGAGGAGTNSGGETSETPEPAKKPTPKPAPKPPPPPAKPFGVTITGVLINDTGTTARKLPAGKPAGADKGVRAVHGGDTPGSLPLGATGVLALLVIWGGALRERRNVRLRLA
jgi:hypothetical protein